jgi:Mg2+ and Co2+ transporter CorA
VHIEDSIRAAVTEAVNHWANPKGMTVDPEWLEDVAVLTKGIVAEIEKSDFHREVRSLRWKVKNLGKQNGKQAQRIYELRCQLAEARGLITVDASAYRSLRDQARAVLGRVNEQNREIRELQLREANRDVMQVDTERLERKPEKPLAMIRGLA